MTENTPTKTSAPAENKAKASVAKHAYLKHYLSTSVLFSALVFCFIVLVRPKLTSVMLHEIVGIIVLFLILIHVFLFKNFFKFAYKDKTPYSLYKDSVVCVLIFFFVISIITGIMGSKELFFNFMQGLGLEHEFWKDLHEDLSKILINIIAIHIGMYWSRFISWFSDSFSYRYKINATLIHYTCSLAILLVCISGFVLIFNSLLPTTITEWFTLPIKEMSRIESNFAKGLYTLTKAAFYGWCSYIITSILLHLNTKKGK